MNIQKEPFSWITGSYHGECIVTAGWGGHTLRWALGYLWLTKWQHHTRLVVVYKVNLSSFFFKSKMSLDLVPATIYSPLLGWFEWPGAKTRCSNALGLPTGYRQRNHINKTAVSSLIDTGCSLLWGVNTIWFISKLKPSPISFSPFLKVPLTAPRRTVITHVSTPLGFCQRGDEGWSLLTTPEWI